VVAMMRMTPWHRRQGRDARLVNSLRGHVETMWAIACTLTGDEATAVEVVKEVVRGTLPQPYRSRQRGLRLEVVIAATEAGATRAFSPLDHRVRSGSFAAVLGPQASALRRAFSRRVSWDVQAPLWATEVEDIAESDVANRLGQSHPGMEAGRVALRRAYIDLRSDLDVNCRETLRNAFGSSASPERRAQDSHLGSCALCQAETRWLTDLGSALRSVPPAMPSEVWEEARRLALGDTRRPSLDPPRSDGATQTGNAISAPPRTSPAHARTRVVVVQSAADQENPAVGDATTATNGCEPPLVCRAVEAQKVKADEVEVRQVDAEKVDHVVHR
jgi:hypothetical protein